MGIRLGTQAVPEAVQKRQDEDPEFRKRLKGLNFSLILVGTDDSENHDWQYCIRFDNGSITKQELERQPAPSKLRELTFNKEEYSVKVVGNHQDIYGFVTGELDIPGLLSRVKIEGDFGSFVNQMKGFEDFIDFLKSMNFEA